MKRDLHSTVTGWKTLDRLTLPFWVAYCKFQEWRFYRELGNGDAQRGKRMLRGALHPSNRENS